jgi:hypothetical protein
MVTGLPTAVIIATYTCAINEVENVESTLFLVYVLNCVKVNWM